MTEIKIGVATHKLYEMPKDNIYVPIQSGTAISSVDLDYEKDNQGVHISDKNLNYCELTALYWLWKNTTADYKGLTHYRRHFSNKNIVSLFTTGSFENVLNSKQLKEKLKTADIILPKKRNYYIETIESHYNHTHYEEDLIETKKIIATKYPEYAEAYKSVLNRKSAHMFNMFIMKDSYFNEYCEWLFAILFSLEEQLDISNYSAFHQRVFGRISEILLDVWITKNNYSYTEIPVIFMEKQNWTEKIVKFLKAKLIKQKY